MKTDKEYVKAGDGTCPACSCKTIEGYCLHGVDKNLVQVEFSCPCCGRWAKDIYTRRQNTQYVNEESNWVAECGECHQLHGQMWADQWDEYYSMVM